jgi:hypothetical protein
MYKKIIIIAGLMIPAMSMADRPAMSEHYDESEQAQPLAIEQPEQAVVVVEEAAAEDIIVEEVVVEPVRGDVLEMQPGDTIVISPVDFPRRGMSMDKVQNELGRPAEISAAVGEPPITSWAYPDRVVFFEHSRVIHVVEKR